MVSEKAETVIVTYSSEKWLFAQEEEVIEHYLEVTGAIKSFFANHLLLMPSKIDLPRNIALKVSCPRKDLPGDG